MRKKLADTLKLSHVLMRPRSFLLSSYFLLQTTNYLAVRISLEQEGSVLLHRQLLRDGASCRQDYSVVKLTGIKLTGPFVGRPVVRAPAVEGLLFVGQ